MKTLLLLDYIAELLQLVFEFGLFSRKYIVPAIVYVWVFVEYYILPAVGDSYTELVNGRLTEQVVRIPVLAKTQF